MEINGVPLNMFRDKTSKLKMLITTSYNIQYKRIQEMI